MQRTNIYLAERQTAVLDNLADELSISRAELIRDLLDQALAGRSSDAAADLAAIQTSFGSLPHVARVSSEQDERQRHLDELWEHQVA
jgi:metal-responsive CopG/Arc/MetJ family transcriptional regulator